MLQDDKTRQRWYMSMTAAKQVRAAVYLSTWYTFSSACTSSSSTKLRKLNICSIVIDGLFPRKKTLSWFNSIMISLLGQYCTKRYETFTTIYRTDSSCIFSLSFYKKSFIKNEWFFSIVTVILSMSDHIHILYLLVYTWFALQKEDMRCIQSG